MRVRRGFLIGLVAMLFLGVGVGIGVIALDFLDRRPATIVKAAFNADDVTYRDGRMQLYFDVTKLRECPSTTTRWLWTWVDYKGEELRLFMPLGVSFAGVTDVGEDRYLMSIEVPRGVWDGTWYYLARDVTQCGGMLSLLRNQVTETPSIEIKIKGTKAQPPAGVTPSKSPPRVRGAPIPNRSLILNGGEPLP